MTTTDINIADLGQGDSRPVTELFHRLNSVLPLNQEILSVPLELPAAEALALMEEHRFSQLPVIVGREVLGLFSFRSYARAVLTQSQKASKCQRFDPLELLVEDCLEKPEYARLTDEFVDWFEHIDQHNAVLVGEPDHLQGIVTAMDILKYLYSVASPFVLVAEVELALRALMRLAVDAETLATCAQICLAEHYKDEPPKLLEDMTFNDYVQIVGDGRTWDHFQPVMGGSRNRTRAKLVQLRDLRNVIFHFKREITVEEYDTLAAGREWVLMKARAMEARRGEATQ